MKKIMGKTTVKLTGVTFEGRQGKIINLNKNKDNAWLSLERHPVDSDKNRIYVVAHIENQRPFRIGTLPTSMTYWLAPRMDEALKRANINNTKPANEYLVHVTDFKITGGGATRYGHPLYFGVNTTIIYEVKRIAG